MNTYVSLGLMFEMLGLIYILTNNISLGFTFIIIGALYMSLGNIQRDDD